MSQHLVYKKPRRNKKYRFQLLHKWLVTRYNPTSVLDVAGGKGLLTYLLKQSGWNAVVVDPVSDFRPMKYRSINSSEQVKLSKEVQESIPRIKDIFTEDMVKGFNLIIGLHAHGCNMKIINACRNYNKDFLLLPCCVVGEPIEKKPNIDWLESLVQYAVNSDFDVKRDTLDFKGQNILIYTDRNLIKI